MSCCGPKKTECCGGAKKADCGQKKECCGSSKKAGTHESIQEFYGTRQAECIQGKTAPACSVHCSTTAQPPRIQGVLDLIHPDVIKSYFGCGLPYPGAIEGCKILDFGSGAGRDCFLLAHLAGPEGEVVGVDMTPAMLEKATEMIPYHREKFGFPINVQFKHGYLEELDQVPGLHPDSFDVIISNCVINLTQDKGKVMKEAFRLLKPGGEICCSDVFAEKPLPEQVKNNELVWNECFGGALPWTEFLALSAEIGYLGPFVISSVDYAAADSRIEEVIEGLKFWSVTYRLFKPGDSDASDGKNQLTYLGTIPDNEDHFQFLEDVGFKAHETKAVESAVRRALLGSRFRKHFQFL